MARRRSKPKRRVPVIRKARPPGASPGVLTVDPGAPRPRITVSAYGPEDLVVQQIDDPDRLREYLGRWPVVWVNVDGLGDAEVLRTLGEIFGIHRLALEDVTHVYQRAKVEPYPEHLFVVARMVHLADDGLDTEQVSFFVGPAYVLSFQEEIAGDSFDQVRARLRDRSGRIRHAGAGYLAYALLDALIDAYFPVLERYGDQIEALEAEVVGSPQPRLVGRVHSIKRDLLELRRAIWPHREAVNALLREESPQVAGEVRLHLRDCYDHTVQLLDIVETYRELTSGLLDVYLTSMGNRMTEVMKVLTIFTAIFIPLTFIAGVYGMNFEHMPELRWRFGYLAVMAFMAALAGGMLLAFRRRGWIGSRGAAPQPRPPGEREHEP